MMTNEDWDLIYSYENYKESVALKEKIEELCRQLQTEVYKAVTEYGMEVKIEDYTYTHVRMTPDRFIYPIIKGKYF